MFNIGVWLLFDFSFSLLFCYTPVTVFFDFEFLCIYGKLLSAMILFREREFLEYLLFYFKIVSFIDFRE